MARLELGGQKLRVVDDLEQANALRVNMQNSIDAVSGGLITVDFPHHEIHEGDHYMSGGTVTLGLGGVLDVLVTTPDTTKWAHLEGLVNSSGAANVLFYEGATVSDNGSTALAVNRNRNSENTAAVIISTGPTVSSPGSVLYPSLMGVGQNSGGLIRSEDEFILRQNTLYVIRITSEAASNRINWRLDWYEHTNDG